MQRFHSTKGEEIRISSKKAAKSLAVYMNYLTFASAFE
jgi:hypothetical protein